VIADISFLPRKYGEPHERLRTLPNIEPDYQARAEEHERREERRFRALDNAWETYQGRWEELNPPLELVKPKPPAVEPMQLELDFWKTA